MLYQLSLNHLPLLSSETSFMFSTFTALSCRLLLRAPSLLLGVRSVVFFLLGSLISQSDRLLLSLVRLKEGVEPHSFVGDL